MEADFSGWATKAGLKCSDGRTIMTGAFKHQDQMKVPLVWQHQHKDPENVLGHVMLTNKDEGVWADAFFNNSARAQHMRDAVQHEDITMMSIWANELLERSGKVLHGAIREVSLVLSGANPGALIENVSIRHSDGGEEMLDDEVIIYTGEQIVHADAEEDSDEIEHADEDEEGGETVKDVYDDMSDKQKEVVHYFVSEALQASGDLEEGGEAEQDNVGDAGEEDTLNHDSDQEGTETMTGTSNVFEKDETANAGPVLSHSDIDQIFADAAKGGSLRDAVQAAALQHGIENLDVLFPEARALTRTPEWDKRDTGWVSSVLGGARKSPFSRVKTWTADLTFEQARAKGYIKGDMKKEEFFSVAKRETTPQTIYKKQKLDRDDILDITDFDVVSWMKGEMRMMLDEEIARAILVGDGREVSDEDKIKETNIRPIAGDDPFYTLSIGVNLADADSSVQEVIDALILNREFYKGTGTPTFYTTENFIAQCRLLKDADGRKLYRSIDEIAADLRVTGLVPVEILDEYPEIVGVMVNMSDYVVGSDKGGNVTMFDDFDIDYNQYKYLIETRLSGALAKPRSAVVVYSTAVGDTAVVPEAPTQDPDTFAVTIPVVTGVTYTDGDGNTVSGTVAMAAGDVLNVQAWADSNYYFAGGFKTRWSFMRQTGS